MNQSDLSVKDFPRNAHTTDLKYDASGMGLGVKEREFVLLWKAVFCTFPSFIPPVIPSECVLRRGSNPVNFLQLQRK